MRNDKLRALRPIEWMIGVFPVVVVEPELPDPIVKAIGLGIGIGIRVVLWMELAQEMLRLPGLPGIS